MSVPAGAERSQLEKTMMKRFALGLLAALVMAAPATAQKQMVINVSTWGGPTHGVNTIVWPTWKQWIEEATDNRVTLNLIHDMGPPTAQMDLIADGVADVTWFFQGFVPGRFALTQLPEFPTFQEFSSEAGSAAYWRTHQEYLAQANEHRGVELMAVGMHGPGQIFLREKIERLDGLPGKRVRVGGGLMSDIASELGLVGVLLPPTAVYESGATGVIDGAMLTLETLRSMRVADVMTTAMSVPGGIYRGTFAIMMNPDTWQRISPEDREAIMAVSGEKLSRLFGYMMDVMDERGVEYHREKGNHFVTLPEEDIERLKGIRDELFARWSKSVSRKLKNPEEAFEFFQAQLSETAELPPISEEAIEVRP